ncbi:aldehyde dehydrogenase 22A1-like [Aristolochia californica]|uniref:aldehyde dehydrogenase 22A1-like n=1 Tax=Aristolochia californica TaxID=171875 RepID=UPI0035E215AF
MQEEAFGPIIPIMKFSTDAEAIELANDSNYGLGCAVFSSNQCRAKERASKLHYGVAAINDFATTYMCQSLPFGGVKHRGFGWFAGVEGLRACCLVKSIVEDRHLTFVLGNDGVAAQCMVLHLLSRVHARVDFVTVGNVLEPL